MPGHHSERGLCPIEVAIPDVREGLTNEEVEELMQVIIANNTFLTKNGTLVTPYSAKIVSKSSTVIELKK